MLGRDKVVHLTPSEWGIARAHASTPLLLLDLLIETSLDVVYVYDRLEGRYVYVSGRCKEVLGYQPDEIMRLSSDDVEQLIHPDDRARAHAHYARQATLREDEITEATYRIGRTNGEYRLLQCRQKLLSRDQSGAPRRILGIAADITEQKSRESELHSLKSAILDIREEERQRIAQEMHDTAVQHLVGAALILHKIGIDDTQNGGTLSGSLDTVRRSLSRALNAILEPLKP